MVRSRAVTPSRRPRVGGRGLALLAAAAAVLGSSPASAAGPATAPAAPAAPVAGAPGCGQSRAGHVSCLLRMRIAGGRGPDRVRPAAASATPSAGYTPADLEQAYALPASSGGGQVVAVVDAYDDPRAESDLAAYRAAFGLPACTTASGCLRIVDLSGGVSAVPSGWDIETSLDLDMVSAGCPLCSIVLVQARSDGIADIYPAIQAAAGSGATEVSMSFGAAEDASETSHDPLFDRSGVAFVAASGDCGYGVTYPAASPDVTAVGGTTLLPAATPRGWSETAWVGAPADQDLCGEGSPSSGAGSGCSQYEAKPSWQHDTGCPRRTVADVAADADLDPGVAVYDSLSGGWMPVGGTSAAAPLVAGAWALSGGLGSSPPGARAFYDNAAQLSDVQADSYSTVPCTPAYLCNGVPGYDGPTGLGTLLGGIVTPAAVTAPAVSGSTAVAVSWAPGPGVQAASYTLWAQDGSGPWNRWLDTGGTGATFHGFAGHTYTFHAEVHGAHFDSGPPNGVGEATTSISASAPPGPFTGLYAVDGYGGLRPGSSPPLTTTGSWPGWSIVRGIAMAPGGEGGWVLDGWGGIHPFGATGEMPATLSASGYWRGWDIARGLAIGPGGQGGYVVDGWGGVHPVGDAPPVQATAYWPGWDIARGLALDACDLSGHSGWVLDGWGGIHPFGGAPALPVSGYWRGWDIARGIATTCAGGQPGGWVLDGWGGLHPFGAAPALPITGYWQGWDIARGLAVLPGGGGGEVVDGWGGFHPFGSAPAVDTPVYTPAVDTVRSAAAG
jgi:Subtilase family